MEQVQSPLMSALFLSVVGVGVVLMSLTTLVVLTQVNSKIALFLEKVVPGIRPVEKKVEKDGGPQLDFTVGYGDREQKVVRAAIAKAFPGKAFRIIAWVTPPGGHHTHQWAISGKIAHLTTRKTRN